MTTSGTIKVMFSLIKNIKGEKPMSGFTTNLDLAYIFASVNNCYATRRSVAFADVFAEFTLSAITALPGID